MSPDQNSDGKKVIQSIIVMKRSWSARSELSGESPTRPSRLPPSERKYVRTSMAMSGTRTMAKAMTLTAARPSV